jgi:aryl-alcohol dehydrogenase-like predicted oxidoreductase
VVEQPGITSAIVGSRTAKQLGDTLGAATWTLSTEASEKLTSVSHLPHRYPEAMEANMHERRDSAVGTQAKL